MYRLGLQSLIVSKQANRCDITLVVPMDILNPGGLIAAGMLRANGRTVRQRMGLRGGRRGSAEARRQGRRDICMRYRVDAASEQELVDVSGGLTQSSTALRADGQELLAASKLQRDRRHHISEQVPISDSMLGTWWWSWWT